MIYADVSFDDRQIDNVYSMLAGLDPDKRGPQRAMCNAINRTAVSTRFEIVKAIIAKHEVRGHDIRKDIRIPKKADFNRLEAQIQSIGYVIPLDRFTHSPSGYSEKKPKVGVHVKVRKDSGGKRLPGTFFIPNNPHIFERENKEPRGDLVKKFGPAIPSMMRVVFDEEGEQGIQDRAETRLMRELEHQVDYLLKSNGGSWSGNE